MNPAVVKIYLERKNNGVDFSVRQGAVCPACGAVRCPVTRTLPWEGDVRIRYHKCRSCRTCFKSIQQD